MQRRRNATGAVSATVQNALRAVRDELFNGYGSRRPSLSPSIRHSTIVRSVAESASSLDPGVRLQPPVETALIRLGNVAFPAEGQSPFWARRYISVPRADPP